MRKLLVKHLVGFYAFKLFGRTFTALRCTRIGYKLFLILMAFGVADNAGYHWAEYGIFACGFLFAVYAWMTFDWMGLGYFELWPPKPEELDDMQKGKFDL